MECLVMPIASIHSQFESEAIAAKLLFADLAKVELYIAESYRSRAFVELLQNADDAGASKFVIRQVGQKLLVANNGRPFSAEDIMALCQIKGVRLEFSQLFGDRPRFFDVTASFTFLATA